MTETPPASSKAGTGTDGADGNTQLTAVAGIFLAVLLIIEAVTVLDVRGMITLHFFVGLMLIPPVLLKTGSTAYRFGSYYGGRDAYVRKGPPHIILRLIGPLVVISALLVLATGVWMLLIKRSDGTILTIHQGSFIALAIVVSLHFLGHAKEAAVASWRELRRTSADPVRRRRSWRLLAVAVSLVAGVGLAAALMPPSMSPWKGREHGYGRDIRH